MASPLDYKIYRGTEYIAGCKHPEHAALIAWHTEATIKFGGIVVWRGAKEPEHIAPANIARIMADRLTLWRAKRLAELEAKRNTAA